MKIVTKMKAVSPVFVWMILFSVIVAFMTACGSQVNTTKIKNNRDTQASVAFADHVAAKCVPNAYTLRSHAGRQAAKTCVVSQVPPRKRQAFGACVTQGIEHGHVKAALNDCYLREVR